MRILARLLCNELSQGAGVQIGATSRCIVFVRAFSRRIRYRLMEP